VIPPAVASPATCAKNSLGRRTGDRHLQIRLESRCDGETCSGGAEFVPVADLTRVLEVASVGPGNVWLLLGERLFRYNHSCRTVGLEQPAFSGVQVLP
jgi:hypothetical protein